MDVTLSLPDAVYEQFQRAAEKARRTVDEVLSEAVAAMAPLVGTGPEGVQAALGHLAYLNDAALWRAARATMLPEQRARLAELHELKRESGLGPGETAEEGALVALYRETVLVRAQAAVLLKMRGYDVADPAQFEPVE
jgi:hypothetical protein